jgi:hypothetical protein
MKTPVFLGFSEKPYRTHIFALGLLHLQKSAKCPKKGLKMEKNSKNTFF